MSILARKTVINLQLAGLTQLYESSSCQKHVIDRLTQFAIHLHGRHQEVKKTAETQHSFLTFLTCEIHGVFSKFSRKGLPYSEVGPPDLRYLISRECWHSAVNFWRGQRVNSTLSRSSTLYFQTKNFQENKI